MPKMNDTELSSIVGTLLNDTTSYNSEFMGDNEDYLKRYNQECYGDEETGYSQVVASDVRDIVDSDMTSMVRVFLGSGDVMVFDALSDDEAEVEEALEKTELVNWMVLQRPSAYNTIHGFLKDAEIQKMGVVHYFIDTVRTTREELIKDQTAKSIHVFMENMKEKDKSIERVDIVEKEPLKDEGKFHFRLRVTVSNKELIIKNIPTEDFLLTTGSACLDDASAVGHQTSITRSELVASGMSEEEVNKFPASSDNGDNSGQTGGNQSNNMKEIRWRDEGGAVVDAESFTEWSQEKVDHVLLFALVDYDGDGIAERRRIVKIGETITENEPYDHIPYAVTSCIIEPHKAIGNGRASLVMQDQSINTELERGMLDNIYDVSNPRSLLGDGVNTDDFLDDKRNGAVRMKANSTHSARDSIIPIPVQYVGGEIMQVKQSRDQSKASRTGTMLDSQGLEADQLHQETATRFTGIERANEAKIELVARNHAEVGFRKLFDGVAWTLQRFMDRVIRVKINGKPISVNPSEWEFETVTKSQVGLGAGAGDKAVNQLSGIYSIQQQLKATGSLLVDDQDLYNTLDQMVQALGYSNTSDFFNDPSAPQELIFAQLQQVTAALQESQAMLDQLSQQNPLKEAEMVKAQASLITAQSKGDVELIKAQANKDVKEMEMLQKTAIHESDQTFKYTQLEVENNVDIPTKGVNG
jgi:hypothetical protein